MGGLRTQRSAWEDRFSQPTDLEVLSHLTRQYRCCAEAARGVLRGYPEVRETLDWMGIPWRWTFVYKREHARCVAYLIPMSTGPRWVLTVPLDVAGGLPLKQFARPVREGLVAATRVGAQLWPQWDVQTKAQVQEVAVLLECLLASESVSA